MATYLSRQENAESLRTASPLVLASASPRRSEILRELGFEFGVVPANIDEDSLRGLAPDRLAGTLASKKAGSVSAVRPGSCVIAADTVVELDGISLGKPSDAAEAASMLDRLSGRTHLVHTGIAVRNGHLSLEGAETTEVKMRRLATAEVDAYARSGAAMDKAGAYGIQDEEFSPVESYSGSYLNVVGLPVGLFARLLLDAGEIDGSTAAELGRRDSR